MAKSKYLVPLGILIVLAVVAGGCSAKYAAEGSIVSVHYTGTLADGTQFDSSEGGDPLEFTVGAGQLIRGFDNAVRGMKVGETKTVTIPAAEAYGARNEKLVQVMERADLPEGTKVEVGTQMAVTFTDGRSGVARITEVTETTVTLDANHFLAGEDLIFEIRLVKVR